MLKAFKIVANSFRLAMLELKNNKLRTFLSLLGVTFGIFCIIGVLSTVGTLHGEQPRNQCAKRYQVAGIKYDLSR